MISFHLNLLNKRYKGQYVRLYSRPKLFVEGLYLGTWNGVVVMMACSKEDGFRMQYVPVKDIKCFQVVKGFGHCQHYSKFIYSSVN